MLADGCSLVLWMLQVDVRCCSGCSLCSSAALSMLARAQQSCLSAVGRFGGLSCYGDVTGSRLLPGVWGSCLLKEGLGPEGFRELSSAAGSFLRLHLLPGRFRELSSAAGRV